jgi:hypothetical protein
MNKVKVVCASQLGASPGTQLWSVAEDGRLFSTFQPGVYERWQSWCQWPGAPENISALASAQSLSGEVSLWAISDGRLFCTSRIGLGADSWEWLSHSAFEWPIKPPLRISAICASEPSYSGPSGRQLWAVGGDGRLYSTYERNRLGGSWSTWELWAAQPLLEEDARLVELTTAQNGQGEVQLWALDSFGVLHSRAQIKAGETWDPWVKGWSNAPKDFSAICAIRQGGGFRGRMLWGVTENRKICWTLETAPSGGRWTKWEEFPNPIQPVASLCAGRNASRVILLARAQDNSLHNTTEIIAEDKWDNAWDVGGMPPLSMRSLSHEIDSVLRRGTDLKYNGLTYQVTSENTFTLLDTPRLWDRSDATAPKLIPACENLRNEITKTIIGARTIIDITMMWETAGKSGGLPSGDFQKALNQGFRALNKRGTNLPQVWIMIGVPLGPVVRPEDLRNWVTNVIQLDDGPSIKQVQFPIVVAACKQTPLSWNHSKIVAADGVRTIVGGHNLWSDHYLGATPVHDVSGLFEGSVVAATHRFAAKL